MDDKIVFNIEALAVAVEVVEILKCSEKRRIQEIFDKLF